MIYKLKNYIRVLQQFYLLGYNKLIAIKIAFNVINESFEQKKDIIVSRSGDGELLIFTKKDDYFYNILIDNDGLLEFIFISKDRKQSYNIIYDKEINYHELVKKLE